MSDLEVLLASVLVGGLFITAGFWAGRMLPRLIKTTRLTDIGLLQESLEAAYESGKASTAEETGSDNMEQGLKQLEAKMEEALAAKRAYLKEKEGSSTHGSSGDRPGF
jgi:hypothetical protein